MTSLSYSKERVEKYTSAIGENLPSLRILNAVEKVIDKLCRFQRDYEELAYLIYGLEISGDVALDPEGESVASFERAETRLKQFVLYLEKLEQSAQVDPELNGDHEESVVMEFKKTINCAKYLISVLQDKRWQVMDHDADSEEVIGPFESAEDLIADLNR